MPTEFSIRTALQGHLHDCAEQAGFRCTFTENLIRDLTSLLAHYREEDVPLFPEVFIISSLGDLNTLAPGASRHRIGAVPLDPSDAAKILKDTAGLAGNGWSVYIVKVENREFQYGVFRSQRHSFATTAEESMFDVGATSPIIVIRNRGHLTVEVLDSSKHVNTISLTSSPATPSRLASHVRDLVEAVVADVETGRSERLVPYLTALFTGQLQRSHGSLLVVIGRGEEGPPQHLADGVWIDPPVCLADCFKRAIEVESAEALAELQAGESLLANMINSDGIVALSSDCKVMAYRVFVSPTADEKSSVPDTGGGRRRTFAVLRERVDRGLLRAAFFRSQDGHTECRKK